MTRAPVMQIPGPLGWADAAGRSRIYIFLEPHPCFAQGSAEVATRTTVVASCLRCSATEEGEDISRSWCD